MREKREKLGDTAAVKGTMVMAHLAWAADRVPDLLRRLAPHLDPACAELIERGLLATDWLLFRHLIQVDRGIAAAVGGPPEKVFRELGHHSAEQNLGGVYKGFVQQEPHRFFTRMSFLHSRFMNFGRSSYEAIGERTGRIRVEDYAEYSPVFCESAIGYYSGALEMMKAPPPIQATETLCQCLGDPACVFDLAWA